jgi:hypothetical protein
VIEKRWKWRGFCITNNAMKKLLLIGLFVSASAASAAPSPAAIDPMIQTARQCTQHFAALERRHGMPSQLLAAIANTESGRWNKTLGMVLPWPWTINAEGKGFYFNSKAEAIAKVRSLQAQGVRSIDVGCMQVNLRHHPTAFANLDQAFDPAHNVAYGARYLRQHYNEMGNWNAAIAAYHSKTPAFGNKYLARVQKSWDSITGKVRTSRDAVDSSYARRPDKSPSYRVIELSDTDGSRKSVRTLRPQTSQSMTLAMRDASPAASEIAPIRAQDRLSSVPVSAASATRANRAPETATTSQAPRVSHKSITVGDAPATAKPRVTSLVPPASASQPVSSAGSTPTAGAGNSARFIFVD